MSDIERFQGLPECAALYRDLGLLYRSLGNELLQHLDPPSSAALAQIEDHRVNYYFREMASIDLEGNPAEGTLLGAEVIEPRGLSRPHDFLALEVALLSREGDQNLEPVNIPRALESPRTSDVPVSHLGTIVASVEDDPFLASGLDIDAAAEIAAEAAGQAFVPENMPDILAFHEIMRAEGHPVQYLSPQECATIRAIIPHMEFDPGLTAHQNGLGEPG